MARIPAGAYTIGSPAQHPLANPAAMPQHRVELKSFRIERTEVTNAQFAEFLNALPVKPAGAAPGGKVAPANIPRAFHSMLLEFSSRPSPYTMIDLDDEDARIGVRQGRFAARACRAKSNGRRRRADRTRVRSPGGRRCRRPSSP